MAEGKALRLRPHRHAADHFAVLQLHASDHRSRFV